ncbi:MAG: hypothetical protein ACTHJ4_02820 [Candidatus Nucleicultricaceae bacterium]
MKKPLEYLDEIIGLLFLKSGAKSIFFPWFILGPGYVVDSKDQVEQIYSFLRKFYVIALLGGLLVGLLLGPFILLLILILMGAWYYYQTNQFVSELKKSNDKIVVDDKVNEIAQGHDLNELVGIAAIMVAFILIGFLMIWKGGLISRFIGFILMIIFGGKTYFFEMVIRRKLATEPSAKKVSTEKLVKSAKSEMHKMATKVTQVLKTSADSSKKTTQKGSGVTKAAATQKASATKSATKAPKTEKKAPAKAKAPTKKTPPKEKK